MVYISINKQKNPKQEDQNFCNSLKDKFIQDLIKFNVNFREHFYEDIKDEDTYIETYKSILEFFEEDPFRLYVPGKYRHPGIYAIFEGKPDKENCLYVGLSETDTVTGRIYRFTKELLDCSRDDEDHPAAKKARNNRINPMNLYCKILLKKDLLRKLIF